MEKPNLKTFESPVLSAVWDEWATEQPNELFDRYRKGHDQLRAISKENLLELAERALGQALQDGAGSFFLLAMFAVQAAGKNLKYLPILRQVPPLDKDPLVKHISSQIASMAIIQNPTPLESTDIPDEGTCRPSEEIRPFKPVGATPKSRSRCWRSSAQSGPLPA